MIIEISDDNSIIKWKNNDNDEWKSAEISDLIKVYEARTQGEWIKHDTWDYSCSLCDSYSFAEDGNVEELPNFCPYCGAKMKGDAE